MSTEIVEYSKTEAALATLAERYKGVLFDVSTREGMQAAIKGRAELRGYRVDLEKTRKLIKEPALRRAQLIDSEARRITQAIEALEVPIDDQIKADERRKIAEAEAVAKAEADRTAAEEAARKAAEEKVLAAQRAEIARQQEELAERKRQQDAIEAEARRKIEEEQRAARMKIEEEERVARQSCEAEEARINAERRKAEAERAAAEEAQRKLRQAEEDKLRAEREAEEAKKREELRKQNELIDARAMLETFKKRFGHRAEFAAVIKAINSLKETA